MEISELSCFKDGFAIKSKNKRAGSSTAGTACSTGHDLGQKYGEVGRILRSSTGILQTAWKSGCYGEICHRRRPPSGRWLSDISNKVSDENLRRVSLTDEQLERLKRIGFKQEKKTARQWNEKYELAKNYYEIHGDLNVPLSYCVNDVKLGRWISNIRSKTETSGIQRNGIKPGQDQTAGQYLNWK